ncbi:MAG TPA: hypothetical protein VGH66_01420 [Acidimicrobiales bacterium]|jgi:hypothetical protein
MADPPKDDQAEVTPEQLAAAPDDNDPAGPRCPVCNVRVSPRGALKPPALITAHLRADHGIEPPAREHRPTGRKATGRPKVPEPPATPLSVLTGSRDDLKGKRPPTADQLAAAMGKGLGYGTVLAAGAMVAGDPRINSEDDENAAVSMLSASPEEAKAICHPIARYLAASKLNVTAGRSIVDNSDIFDSLYAMAEVVSRMRRYSRARASYLAAVTPIPMGPGPAPAAADVTAPIDLAAARVAASAAAGYPQSPPGTQGIVVTPEMLPGNNGQSRPGRIANAQEEF